MKKMKFFAAAAAIVIAMSTSFAANRSNDPNFKWDRQEGKVLIAASGYTVRGFSGLGFGGEVAYLFPGKLGVFANFKTAVCDYQLPYKEIETCRNNSGLIGIIADTTPDFPVGFFFKAGVGISDGLKTLPLFNLGCGARASYGMFYTRVGIDYNVESTFGNGVGWWNLGLGLTVGISIPTSR